MGAGYLSKDRVHLAQLQRQRRSRITRIDYMPGPEALEVIRNMRAKERPGSVAATNSAVLDSIVTNWARLSGITKPEFSQSSRTRTPAYESGVSQADRPEFTDHSARARLSSALPPRVTCGAKRHSDGQPCQARNEPGKFRCRFHGGRSTGPRTAAGKARALANLKQYAARLTAPPEP